MFRIISTSLTVLFLAVAMAAADTIVLKSGEKIEGRILGQTDTEVRVEVSATGIVDERKIPKADIERVEKENPAAKAWETLQHYKPGANSLAEEQYDRLIAPLTAFSTQHPEDPHAADAKKALEDFEAEKKRVAAGEIKLDGNWLTMEQVEKDRYQINAARAFNYMREQQARGDLIGALNAFDVIERDYPGSKVFPDAVAIALTIIQPLQEQAAARKAAIPEEDDTQMDKIAAALEPSKSEMKNAVQRAHNADLATLEAAKTLKLTWLPYLPNSLSSMEAVEREASSALSRLSSLDLGKMRESVALATEAKKQIAARDLAAAEASLQKARDTWSQNEMLAQIDADLTAARSSVPAETDVETLPQPKEMAKAETAAPSETTGAAPAPEDAAAADEGEGEEEDAAGIRPLHIVLGLMLIAFILIGYKSYKSVKSKASDVLE